MYSIMKTLAPLLKIIGTSLLISSFIIPETPAQEQVLDTSYPILIEENIKTSSSFGYTVSLAKGNTEIPNQPEGWIFIGAPKSNVSNQIKYGDGTNGDFENEAGVVWRCSLGHANNNDACKLMNIDPLPNTQNKKRPKGSPSLENHAHAFIGGSMEIKNNHLVTCGLGWKRGNNTFYNGICYWFKSKDNQKGKSDFNRDDLTNLLNRGTYDHRLMPFFQSSGVDTLFPNYKGPGDTTNAREWQASQAGISVNLFLDGDGPSSSNLLIGAPGVREWSGAVVLYTNSNKPKPEMTRLNRDVSDPTFSEFVVLNRGNIPRKGHTNVKYRWNEYFGYSVSSGRYFNESRVLYAAGAPRANRKGCVAIFEQPPYNKGRNQTYKRQVKEIQEINAPSKQEKNIFGSYFGSVIYSVDLDGNGLDELVIGAPMYSFMKQNSHGSGDHGCVFVYSKSKRESNKMVLAQVLVGSKLSNARFGSAISSIEFDFRNRPKQVYLVIGAPFESSKDIGEGSTGAIYLYKSLANGTLDSEFTQRIVASQFGHPIKAFGTSISNAEDIDNNQTPDLAIGAFESSHAVLLRTRPQIFIQSTLKFQANTTSSQELKEIKRGSLGFRLLSCFTIEEILGVVQRPTEIWVKISFADNRLKFSNLSQSVNELIYRNSIVDTHSPETCEPIYIASVNSQYGFGYGNLPDSPDQDDFQPLTFYQEVWFNATENRPLTLSKLNVSSGKESYNFSAFNPRLPTAQHAKTKGEISISLSECFSSVCRPDIEMEFKFFNTNDAGVDENIKPNDSISRYFLGQTRKEVLMQLSILNRNETTLLKNVYIEWNMKNVRESLGRNKWFRDSVCKEYLCDFKHYVRKDRNATLIQIYLDMSNIFVNSVADLHFTVNAQLNFNDSGHINPVKSSGGLRIVVPKTMALISGSKNSKEFLRSAAKYNVTDNLESRIEKVLYAPFQQRFGIEVLGASVNEVLAEFKIPVVPNNIVGNRPYFLVNFPQTSNLTGNDKPFESINCKDSPFSKSPNKLVRIGDVGNTVVHQSQVTEENRTLASPKNVSQVDTGEESTSEIAEDPEPPTFHKIPALKYPEGSLKFDCNSSETGCIEVTCKIINVRAKRHFHVNFDIYPVKNEIDKLLKESGKNTIFFESTGIVAIFPKDKNSRVETSSGGDIMHYSDKNLAQSVLTLIAPGQVKTWIYIAAGCGGLLLLALIVIGLYFCGFFKRKTRQELNKLRADHHRKSMAAAAAIRASMMVQSSEISGGVTVGLSSGGPTSGAESRENLTEAEVYNEDRDDDNDNVKSKNSKGKAERHKQIKAEVDDKEDVLSVKTGEVDL